MQHSVWCLYVEVHESSLTINEFLVTLIDDDLTWPMYFYQFSNVG